MKRLALSLLLAMGMTAHAALPRVVIDAPLTPVSAPAYAAEPGAISLAAAPRFLGAAPALAAGPAASIALTPSFAAPAPAAVAAVQPAPAAAAPQTPAAFAPALARTPAASVPDGPRAIDALRANAPLADELSTSANSDAPESSARALEGNFNAAASLGDGGSVVGNGPVAPAAGAHAAAGPGEPLLTRLLANVLLVGAPDRQTALKSAFARMLESPTARAYAERFLAENITAEVRFEEFPGSRIYKTDGRKIFFAPRSFVEWHNGRVLVRLNRDYLDTDAEFQEQDLPPTLAHELLGHGLWWSRAARENALQPYLHHELNEMNARLVGWLVDFELDRRFEDAATWSYLSDPGAFLAYIKLRLPYYALTWSTAELARPLETLEERSIAAKAQRAEIAATLANSNTWIVVADHFVAHHGVDPSRLRALRQQLAETAQGYKDEIAILDALIEQVDATIGRMKAEPDRSSERFLQWAATHPLFPDLEKEVNANTARLAEMVSRTPAKFGDESAAAAAARQDHWRGQITFDELVEMYRKDRRENPKHWLN